MSRLLLGIAGVLFIGLQGLAQTVINDDFIKAGEVKTLTAGTNYLLDGFVFVEDGATLIIEPGTVVKGKQIPSTSDNASALIVARGGKLIADGTAEKPIIFTSELDNLNVPNDLTWQDRGLWGGIILLGKATTNRGIDGQIEGIPTGEPRAAYGGTDDHDYSGVLRYVSIRHSGAELSPGDEINGLTFGAVGDKTIIDHVEVFANLDDGYEWFGGTVNTTYLVAAYCADDCFDYDEGWRGKNQFWFGIQGPDKGGRIGEHDGGTIQETAPPFATPTINNATYIGPGVDNTPEGDGGEAIILRDNAGGYYFNSIITQYNGANNGRAINVEDIEGPDSRERMESGQLVFRNNLWWGFGNGNDLEAIVTQDFVRAHFEANQNQIANPQLRNIAWGTDRALDPRPVFNGPAARGAQFQSDSFFNNVEYMGAFAPDAALWTDGWTALDAEQHTAIVNVSNRMISHVTRAAGGFQTTVNIVNPGTNEAKVTLRPFAIDGTALSNVTVTVPGEANWSQAFSTVFNGQDVSHFAIQGPASVRVSVSYKAAQGDGASAQVNESTITTRSFSLQPAEQDFVFDGVALVNVGKAASEVVATFYDADGAVMGSTTVASALAPNAKALYTFDNDNLNGVALIRITSTEDSAATILRGTRLGTTPGYLYQTVPLP
ncbi:MAG: hypothetical protein KDC71_15420 [Acidobacteria bacterium]|nr:hypothetical protein [Acidobacteriota bacterium]